MVTCQVNHYKVTETLQPHLLHKQTTCPGNVLLFSCLLHKLCICSRPVCWVLLSSAPVLAATQLDLLLLFVQLQQTETLKVLSPIFFISSSTFLITPRSCCRSPRLVCWALFLQPYYWENSVVPLLMVISFEGAGL